MNALPPNTPLLRRGLGIGTQRALEASPGSIRTFGNLRKRPERESTILREGVLEGGLVGVLAHHSHLGQGPGEGYDWSEWTDTVVYAELPVANRVLGQAWFGHAQPVSVGATLDLRRGRADAIPAEPKAPDAFTFLPPKGVSIEVEFGVVCAYMEGRVTDPARLDMLCRAASAFADAIAMVVAREPGLDVHAPVAPLADSERRRWTAWGAAQVRWDAPPADFDTAVAAYARIVRGGARRFGLVAGALFFLIATLVVATLLVAGVATGFAAGGVFSAAFAVWALWRIARAAVGLGRELSDDQRDAHARPWGLEAFVTGYATSRGLVVEDPRVAQRRFDCPVRGRAVAALHGPDGHLLLWLDPNRDRWVVRVSAEGVHADRADWSTAALDAAVAARRAAVAA
ncbi:hypothetical protein C8N24_0166 [Solirubrobacter pauli]|uniref:Uncharacterized protein n=1 Tax=Solirubrobacter pauli TaxID=166793 RepID=A0A660LBG7_9ACTN|nr:hypothetical protein [Solirubrobacter pauli]RKQ90364.1 hypothetical protein C8N24_0166 [Solirubrobacter pauli]